MNPTDLFSGFGGIDLFQNCVYHLLLDLPATNIRIVFRENHIGNITHINTYI